MPKRSGFSLLEAVLYLAIVAILLTAVVGIHLTLGGTSSKLGANIAASRNRRVALSAVDYLVRNADGLLKDTDSDCSDFSSDPQVLALYFDSDTYLPGTCVASGGGVRISVEDNRLKLTCYPSIPYNNWHEACDTSVFTAGNSYYLTSPDVQVLSSGLAFATSTATSTSNGFLSITTDLTVNNISKGQISLSATSTASSTVVMRNEQPNGLVTWWSFEDNDASTPEDFADGNDGTCSGGMTVPHATTGLVEGSTYAMDFEYTGDNCTCSLGNPENLNFGNSFSISAWIKPESLAANHRIFYKYGSNKGIIFYVNSSGSLQCDVYNGTTGYTASTANSVITADTSIFHTACIYDYDQQKLNVYAYKKNVGQVATGTQPATIPYLVNYDGTGYVSQTNAFDGVIDEFRLYNRALTNQELWALQSQGAP